MTNAPEKVWRVAAYHPMHNAYGLASWPNPEHAGEGATEYVRADVAQAMVAAALERAEELASLHSDWSADEIEHYRRETQKDARAALDAMLAKAREEREMFAWAMEEVAKAREDALREAASLSWLCFHKCDVEVDVVTTADILDLIDRTADRKP